MKMITSNTDKHYLAVSLSGSDDKEVLGKMAEAMFQEGYVTEGFHDAIIQREENFPTGLPTGEINVAIPHTDIVHNLTENVVVVRLDQPVTFHNMIAPDKEVQVSLLFFIINNSSSSQTNILAQLMDFFTSNGNLEALSKLDSEDKLYQYITETIS